MTKVYRGTIDPNNKDDASIKLDKTKLKEIDFNNVIYGERSQSGAMGNSGGIILYVKSKDSLEKFETNMHEDEKTAVEALRLITINEELFDLYYGGMGNGAFIRKNIDLIIDKKNKCFLYHDGNNKFRIDSSVYGVFKNIAARLEGKTPKGLDVIHKGWEQSLRNIFLKKKSESKEPKPTRRILYIEDDKAIAEVFKSRFEDHGYGVKICDNGEDGLNATLDFRPDLIITGILMPKVSGFDVIYILQNTPETKDIPILVLSALSRDEDIDRAMELGATDYMVMSEVHVKDVIERAGDILGDLFEGRKP